MVTGGIDCCKVIGYTVVTWGGGEGGGSVTSVSTPKIHILNLNIFY